MPYTQTEAVVLKKVDFSETSVIVTFLSPHYGRLACIAKGARRKGNPLHAALDTFNRLELTCAWKESRQVQLLIDASVLDSYSTLKQDLERSAAAAFILETAFHAALANHAAEEQYNAVIFGLESLSEKTKEPLAVVIPVIYALLRVSGVAPTGSDDSIHPFLRGSTLAERQEIIRVLHGLAEGKEELALSMGLTVVNFLYRYASYHLEAPLKSFSFLNSVFKIH
ncbi:MAG: DNA repair protein RecO [Candidatus Hydrogenedentes bacterium]|jgi:recombinational DNA repair protein (RecF pathway)|nr:DNA repair protein RecO [Candidatus Hydrogenedentota bacterium]